MSPPELVVVIIAIFFVVGILVGVITVVAMSVMRTDWRERTYRVGRRSGHYNEPPGNAATGWQEPPGSEDDNRPHWPVD